MMQRRFRRRARRSSAAVVAVDGLLARAGARTAVHRAAAAAAATAVFRTAVEERLKALEAEVAEIKGRLNGLLFLVAGAVLTQVALRLLVR